jgi:hypothetical protein
VTAHPSVEAQRGAAVSDYLLKEEEEGELQWQPARRRATAARCLPARTEVG